MRYGYWLKRMTSLEPSLSLATQNLVIKVPAATQDSAQNNIHKQQTPFNIHDRQSD
jgi:hypothetical protein